MKKRSPELAAQARELRDRWSERQDEFVAMPAGKYDVARAVEAAPHVVKAAPPVVLDSRRAIEAKGVQATNLLAA